MVEIGLYEALLAVTEQYKKENGKNVEYLLFLNAKLDLFCRCRLFCKFVVDL
jgi:hypothetical protein